ncbi:phosphoethanolamine transferase [Gallaecimonas mangrovi]|uniref:phosphoethanolamine transferase n=1 Tax=Gallaecimonas mangrovi TaxID=2291597 RepID=UPI000E2039DD|nr:phosphoethanolamine--lipid A transferase [Gallaecimonas mangrovi]
MFRQSLFWALLAAFIIVVTGNLVLFGKIDALPIPVADRINMAAVVVWLMTGVITLLLLPFTFKPLFKPVVSIIFAVTAVATYFCWAYGIGIDQDMIRNVFETDSAEVGDLISPAMLGVIAAVIVLLVLFWRLPLVYPKGIKGVGFRGFWMVLGLVITISIPWMQYDLMAGTIRNYRYLRHDVAPANWLVSTGKYVASLTRAPLKHQQLGLDATLEPSSKPRLVVMVVGETARAANFGLDGYHRNTTPELAKDDVINFPKLSSCGTSTAISVPCMFSYETQSNFDVEKAKYSDNVLDMLARAGVKVYWRDNNSGCKDVCTRVSYQAVEDLKEPGNCDKECFDKGLYYQLAKDLPAKPEDMLIVLHQKGSHGPAYYKRYPPAFEKFKPVCDSNEPKDCSEQALTNTYDNSILYTDHVLAQVIAFLKNVKGYDTGMLYLSDHGESLGEYGLYLHGAPRWMAPPQQTHIPGVTWLSKGLMAQLDVNDKCMQQRADEPHSQDDIFHSLLGIMGVKTKLYEPKHDWYSPCSGLKVAANTSKS